MCETRFRENSPEFTRFIEHYGKNLSPETANRLLGHVSVDAYTTDIIQQAADSPSDHPVDSFVAPALRGPGDLLDPHGVVARIPPYNVGVWGKFPIVSVDGGEDVHALYAVQPGRFTVTVDSRYPCLFTQSDYDMIENRPRLGSGRVEKTARTVVVCLNLSRFICVDADQDHLTGIKPVIRRFNLAPLSRSI